MKMTRRAIGGLAVATSAALVLASCNGGGSDGGSGGDGGDLTGELSIASWQFLEPNRGDELYAAVQQYSESNPDATVEKSEIARADYETTMSTQLGAGQGPDILVIPDAFFPQLAESGLLVPLDDVVAEATPSGFRDINDNYTWDGEQVAVAWEVVPYALFWNEEILDEAGVEPPTTPEELIEAQEAITEETGITGFTVRHQMGEEAPWWTDHSNWEFGFGGAWSDGENLTLNSAENVAAVEAYKATYDGAGFGRGQDASTYRAAFQAGQLGMSIDNSSSVMTLIGDAVSSEQIGASVLPFPGGGSAYAGFAIGVNAHSDNIDLAKDWIRWLLTDDGQAIFADTLFPSAIATETQADSSLIDANPWVEAFFEQVNDSSSVIIAGYEENTAEIRTIILTQVSRVLTENVSAQEALDAAQEEAESRFG